MAQEKITIQTLHDKLDTEAMMAVSLTDWRPLLAKECQCYVFGENYIAKRFDQINYKFCSMSEAKEILIDNLYALLRFKYFPQSTEEIDKRIGEIVSSFTSNLKTTLRKVSFDKNSDCLIVKMLPDYCVAFRNGVFNFKDNKWLFKYDIINVEKLANKIYMYDDSYIILWYLDYNFESLDINLNDVSLDEFVELMKDFTKTNRNYCFELLYNISHDANDKFSIQRFNHLCEILGYTVLQSFSQYFVLLIGSGQNGKNSLFDGCFTNRVIPRPTSNSLDDIEEDRFITGSLENKAHNIFLETSPKTYTESKMIKALTGSMYQTVQPKGINKYESIINCKYIFAGNDQDKIKFSDNTKGFRRRINMFEIWYTWDPNKKFLNKGDYFDTTFSDSLKELKDDVINTTAYVYFAMYGIMSATQNFTKNFQFNKNDWNERYSDVDLELKDRIESITPAMIYKQITCSSENYEEGKTYFYDLTEDRLYNSITMSELGYKTYDDMLKMLNDEEACTSYFADNDIYLSLRAIQKIIRDVSPALSFTHTIKKMYSFNTLKTLGANKPYVKVSFLSGKLRIIKE